MDKIIKLAKFIKDNNNIVFFGGAGVSTESGIPDFRSADGLYNTKYAFKPEEILSNKFFLSNTEEFYRFYKDKMLYTKAMPNNCHKSLAKLEEVDKITRVITQNIDNLHQMAGSKKVTELHGSVYRNYCIKCKKAYDINYILECEKLPKCSCGGIVKPDVVLYGESLKQQDISNAIESLSNADMVIVGGTSLDVYPAASFLDCYKGDNLVVINKTPIRVNSKAALIIEENIGEVFRKVMELI